MTTTPKVYISGGGPFVQLQAHCQELGMAYGLDIRCEIRGSATGGLELVLMFGVGGGAQRIPILHAVWLPAELGEILAEGLGP